MSSHKFIPAWKLTIRWMTKQYRRRLVIDPKVQVFWDHRFVFAIRLGKNGTRSFSERNRDLPSIPNQWRYLLGGRVTIITPIRRGAEA